MLIAVIWAVYGFTRPFDERLGCFAFAYASVGTGYGAPPELGIAMAINLVAIVASTYALYLALRVRELRLRGAA